MWSIAAAATPPDLHICRPDSSPGSVLARRCSAVFMGREKEKSMEEVVGS